jgi:Protein of unknown function (DUF2637)
VGGVTAETEPVRRDWWVTLGMGISAASAAVSSFAGLRGLAVVAGWPVWLAWLLPLTIDAYAMTATRVWLAQSTRSAKARRFARINAIGAILLSLSGNAVYHLIAVHLVAASWVVVVAVAAVPALVLGLVSHLAVLRTDPAIPAEAEVRPEADLSPAVRPRDGLRYADEGQLMEAARSADQAYRAAHGGKPITRDALRETLRIGGTRASALLRQLKEQVAVTG